MDRERKDELPQMQVGFIDVVCKPLYTTLSESFPWIKPLLDGCLANREKWADLAEKVTIKLQDQIGMSQHLTKTKKNESGFQSESAECF